ncbi:alcohol dehydrogenase catalytic domain-containing protein [Nakamurella sp. YIM 132087]|uniref:Alcohol dehydrogenase catalytic domain-containing protein n=1 Tax=Nakamurella alba TaxID=2665158 RepID=A0A7K1FNN9_9ACTN|nr:zinc-dependent alcohol dehydrogenase family protein [Nakamurella alba]MTD15758.1 alcohol dehydrogenase catalytic domain-containing protein [Nakamurella alba]
MKAVLFTAPETIEIGELPDPTPGPGEVIVAPAAAGICGTDIHILEGDLARSWPTVPGHEFAGTVVAVGAGDKDDLFGITVGDRVAVDPSLYCGQCYQCRRARGNQCERWGSLGVTAPGGAAELVAAPAANCVRLPEHVDTRDAPLIEPLACAIRGYDVLRMALADHVLIYGAGTMGLMMLQLAKKAGAATVTVLDRNTGRLAGAADLGCTATATSADEVAGDHPRGWDVVIDCSGAVPAIEDGLTRVGRGGTYLQFGVSATDAVARFNPYTVYHQEITIAGSMAVLHSFERAADLFATGVIDPADFITHRIPMADYAAAVDLFRAGTGRKVQVVTG